MLAHLFVFSLSPLAFFMGKDETLAATMAMVSLISMGVTAFTSLITRHAAMEMSQAAKMAFHEKGNVAQRVNQMRKRGEKIAPQTLPLQEKDLSRVIAMAGAKGFSWGVFGCALGFNIVQLLRVLIA